MLVMVIRSERASEAVSAELSRWCCGSRSHLDLLDRALARPENLEQLVVLFQKLITGRERKGLGEGAIWVNEAV